MDHQEGMEHGEEDRQVKEKMQDKEWEDTTGVVLPQVTNGTTALDARHDDHTPWAVLPSPLP